MVGMSWIIDDDCCCWVVVEVVADDDDVVKTSPLLSLSRSMSSVDKSSSSMRVGVVDESVVNLCVGDVVVVVVEGVVVVESNMVISDNVDGDNDDDNDTDDDDIAFW